MSIFGQILAKISSYAKQTTGAIGQPAARSAATDSDASQQAAPTPTPSAPAVQPMALVDVGDVLTAISAVNPGPANWRTSIVDLLKLLGLDSDLAARKQLAAELGYTGSTSDSASMNVWLHEAVIAKLAANGGKIPDYMKMTITAR